MDLLKDCLLVYYVGGSLASENHKSKVSVHINCVSLNNRLRQARLTIFNRKSTVSANNVIEGVNTIGDLFDQMCFPKKIKNMNVKWYNDTLMEELVLCWIQYKIHWNTRLAASDVFYIFTESIKFFSFHYGTDV